MSRGLMYWVIVLVWVLLSVGAHFRFWRADAGDRQRVRVAGVIHSARLERFRAAGSWLRFSAGSSLSRSSPGF